MRVRFLALLPALAFHAGGAKGATALTLEGATAVAKGALAACAHSGYHVTVTVLDSSGLPRVILRDDGATPHTLDSSHGKAYTVATFGPSTGLTLSSEIASRILKAPDTAQLGKLPGVLLLGGGAALRAGTELIGAVGVAGAPGAHFDEDCAVAGAQLLGVDKL